MSVAVSGPDIALTCLQGVLSSGSSGLSHAFGRSCVSLMTNSTAGSSFAPFLLRTRSILTLAWTLHLSACVATADPGLRARVPASGSSQGHVLRRSPFTAALHILRLNFVENWTLKIIDGDRESLPLDFAVSGLATFSGSFSGSCLLCPVLPLEPLPGRLFQPAKGRTGFLARGWPVTSAQPALPRKPASTGTWFRRLPFKSFWSASLVPAGLTAQAAAMLHRILPGAGRVTR